MGASPLWQPAPSAESQYFEPVVLAWEKTALRQAAQCSAVPAPPRENLARQGIWVSERQAVAATIPRPAWPECPAAPLQRRPVALSSGRISTDLSREPRS